MAGEEGHGWVCAAFETLWAWQAAEPGGEVPSAERVAELCLRVTELAIKRLGVAVGWVAEPWTREARMRFYDDDDKPRTEAAMRARDRRYACWPEPDWRARFRPALGGDADSALERAVFGADEAAYRRAWEPSDERVFQLKRREPRRSYLGPPSDASRREPDYANTLSVADVRRAYNAAAFANRTGRILNARATVAWHLLAGARLDEQRHCFARFYKSLKQWFRDLPEELVPGAADREPRVIHVHENPKGDRFHTHFALVVPEGVRERFRGAVEGQVRRAVAPWAVAEAEGRRLVVVDARRADRHACEGQWRWLRYMLKGADYGAELVRERASELWPRRELGDVLDWRYQDPGPAPVRERVGVTRALAAAAQDAFVDAPGRRFVSLWDAQVGSGQIDVRELYSDHYLRDWEGADEAVEAVVPGDASTSEEVEARLTAVRRALSTLRL